MPTLTATHHVDDSDLFADYLAALEADVRVTVISADEAAQSATFSVPIT